MRKKWFGWIKNEMYRRSLIEYIKGELPYLILFYSVLFLQFFHYFKVI